MKRAKPNPGAWNDPSEPLEGDRIDNDVGGKLGKSMDEARREEAKDRQAAREDRA